MNDRRFESSSQPQTDSVLCAFNTQSSVQDDTATPTILDLVKRSSHFSASSWFTRLQGKACTIIGSKAQPVFLHEHCALIASMKCTSKSCRLRSCPLHVDRHAPARAKEPEHVPVLGHDKLKCTHISRTLSASQRGRARHRRNIILPGLARVSCWAARMCTHRFDKSM